MSYTISTWVYGLEPYELQEVLPDILLGDLEGYKELYSGSATNPGYFGVELGEFDECMRGVSFDPDSVSMICGNRAVSLRPTDAQIAQYKEMVDSLDDETKQIVGQLTPKVQLIWSTS